MLVRTFTTQHKKRSPDRTPRSSRHGVTTAPVVASTPVLPYSAVLLVELVPWRCACTGAAARGNIEVATSGKPALLCELQTRHRAHPQACRTGSLRCLASPLTKHADPHHAMLAGAAQPQLLPPWPCRASTSQLRMFTHCACPGQHPLANSSPAVAAAARAVASLPACLSAAAVLFLVPQPHMPLVYFLRSLELDDGRFAEAGALS